MRLHDELLDQARHLATREPKKPKQASLRRAISSAYYALFHLLLYEATHLLFPSTPAGLRERASRAFSHGEAKSVCESWAKGNGVDGLTADPIESGLRDVAAALVDLQELRHKADYDLTEAFDRYEVLVAIKKVENAIVSWKQVRAASNAKVFLSALLLHGRWNKYNK
jgi:uncharacterized protein (UPF0332 family)